MLRPIDMTLSIQNSADSRAQGAQAARPEVANQMFADRLEKQVKLQEQQVNQSEKSEVNPDRQGHGGGYQPNRKPAQKKTEATKKSKGVIKESLYDIRV
ncbi:MAG: hypothetical protein LBI27_04355 [Clostridiales bacterium]|jgi:hypothetical protein|nr:hypothetical protein [Clostridiales bacterium]